MSKPKSNVPATKPDALFDRIVSILEQARGNVVRAVNTSMVVAYWLIGREIVQEVQGGEERAKYGEQTVSTLSRQLTERYGRGFSAPSLKSFRQFYSAYAARGDAIGYPTGSQSEAPPIGYPSGSQLPPTGIPFPLGRESSEAQKLSPAARESAHLPIPHPSGVESGSPGISHPTGTESAVPHKGSPTGGESAQGFSPQLSWSHYRALMRVENAEARDFYEREAAECGWSKAQLERQIQSSYYQRILANRGEGGLTAPQRERLPGERIGAGDVLKSPYVLEFLGLPDAPELHESAFEQAIIDNLQSFLLELGKGFAFVARQQHIRFDDEDFYVDLVFYNFILKCFLLIDLKIGRLTHRDVGQMDGYVRLFEDRFKAPGDNPTIGLILCSDKSEAVAKYSVLSEGRQIFASKYLQFLPSEEQLRLEIEKERRLVEMTLEAKPDRPQLAQPGVDEARHTRSRKSAPS
jgi:predicted nuclease of restriction endonuclease-like (RecB) superfamily